MPAEDILNNFMHLVSKLIFKKIWGFLKNKTKFVFKLSNKPIRVFLPHLVSKEKNKAFQNSYKKKHFTSRLSLTKLGINIESC